MWLTQDQWLENMARTQLPRLKRIIGTSSDLLREYESNPQLYVHKLNKLCTYNYQYWYYDLEKEYNKYIFDVCPKWGAGTRYPYVKNKENKYMDIDGEYLDLIFGKKDIITLDTVIFYCTDAVKWGITLWAPSSDRNVYVCKTGFVLELTGLDNKKTITLVDVRNRITRPEMYGTIICLIK